MKYCIDYVRNFKYLDKVDEITIRFRRQDTSLVDFLLLHNNQRVNIYIGNEADFIENDCIYLFDAIAEEHPETNFVFKLHDYKHENVKELLDIIHKSEKKHKYFFDTLIRDWDTLLGYIELSPSDVYIVENLGFEVKPVAELVHPLGMQVRVFPNVAQSSWSETPALKKFFIRPEDTVFYEPYIDVYEFFAAEKSIETYYRIYAIEKKWFGKLNEVIISFNDNEIDSRFILPSFAERRLGCGKRCYKGRPCRVCEAIEGLAAVLEVNNLMIRDFDKE